MQPTLHACPEKTNNGQCRTSQRATLTRTQAGTHEKGVVMSLDSLLLELNDSQKNAATIGDDHLLVLAGAGTGKTKTIVARAAFLISTGVPAERIHIMTFTKQASSEIVERVKMCMGDAAKSLKATTFHSFCCTLITQAPRLLGLESFSIIDPDDQFNLFQIARGKSSGSVLPTARKLQELYSFARNKLQTLDVTLRQKLPDSYEQKDAIAKIMLEYEAKKRKNRYIDFDDMLDIVAEKISTSPDAHAYVVSQFDHILVDEMQDTNPLQWKLLGLLQSEVTLFCVGDDAQSIYGFRGADFKNIHNFSQHVPGSVTHKLKLNYRSTQEILDVSNYLLSKSPLKYDKNLNADRGNGRRPQLHTFENEWAECQWIAEDLLERRREGAAWNKHMILVRTSSSGRVVEKALLYHHIPYRLIGGIKLLQSGHVRDVLAVLQVIANPLDEIAWMRFLTLFYGVGDKTASHIINEMISKTTFEECLQIMKNDCKIPDKALKILRVVRGHGNNVSRAVGSSVRLLEEEMSRKYASQWEKRKKNFRIVQRLAENHTSLSAFVADYLVNPIYGNEVNCLENEDAVTIITIHSAKGTEKEVCYVVNVSPGAFPSSYSQGNENEIEEERRVLYVALTRAKDELIVTRNGYNLWAIPGKKAQLTNSQKNDSSYFFNGLPEGLFDEEVHAGYRSAPAANITASYREVKVGIVIG